MQQLKYLLLRWQPGSSVCRAGSCEWPCVHAGLFSATQTEAVQALARAGLRNPVRVKVDVSASLVRCTVSYAGGRLWM